MVAHVVRRYRRKMNVQKGMLNVDIYLTGCIVAESIGKKACALINPTNSDLVSTKAPYFPVGERPRNIHRHETNASWGGLDIGSNQLYPTQVVDGRVNEFGGRALADELSEAKGPLDVGDSVASNATEQLAHNFTHILHTVPPYPTDTNANDLLEMCYSSALKLASRLGCEVVVSPLLGNGQRGFSDERSVAAAVRALETFEDSSFERAPTICFGLIDDQLPFVFEEAFAKSEAFVAVD